jgi:pimeloyl-ACP methyl ester carboxylesterase
MDLLDSKSEDGGTITMSAGCAASRAKLFAGAGLLAAVLSIVFAVMMGDSDTGYFVVIGALLCVSVGAWLLALYALIVRGHLRRDVAKSDVKPVGTFFEDHNNLRTHYVIYREGKRVDLNAWDAAAALDGVEEILLFVHGFSTCLDVWSQYYSFFKDPTVACIGIDLRGRGFSDATDSESMDVNMFIYQIEDLVHHLQLPHDANLHVVGWSMGGNIALHYAAKHIDSVASVSLMAPAVLSIVEGFGQRLVKAIPLLRNLFVLKGATWGRDMSTPAVWTPVSRKEERHFKRYRDAMVAQGPYCSNPQFARSLLHTICEFDWANGSAELRQLAECEVPLLVMWGTEDTICPASNYAECERLNSSQQQDEKNPLRREGFVGYLAEGMTHNFVLGAATSWVLPKLSAFVNVHRQLGKPPPWSPESNYHSKSPMPRELGFNASPLPVVPVGL